MFKITLKKLDLILLILFPVTAFLLAHLLRLNYFVTTILFYIVPAVYFSFRTPKAIKEVSIFILILFIPIGFIADYIWESSSAWVIPHTVFAFRLFEEIPIENLVWGIGSAYYCLILYEHFLDKGKGKTPSFQLKKLGSITLILFVIFCMFVIFGWGVPTLTYSYLKLGVLLVGLPSLTFLSFFPKLVSKFVKVATYFFAISILNELTALDLDHWNFPSSQYVGRILFFGYHIPLEEVFFFFLLAYIAILSYYEFFIDDKR